MNGSEPIRALDQCVRCGKVIDTELDDGEDFEAIELDDGEDFEAIELDDGGIGIVCAGCITGGERQALDEAVWPEAGDVE